MLYVGHVSLKLKINNRIIEIDNHNKGLPALQRAFCNFLTGNDITHEDVPQFIDLRKKEGEVYSTVLLNKLPLTGKSWEEGKYIYQDSSEEDTYVAKLTAVLSSNSLATRITDGSGEYRLYLQTGSNGTINGVTTGYYDLAYMDISSEALSMVGPGTQAIIEWSLQLLVGSD